MSSYLHDSGPCTDIPAKTHTVASVRLFHKNGPTCIRRICESSQHIVDSALKGYSRDTQGILKEYSRDTEGILKAYSRDTQGIVKGYSRGTQGILKGY